MKGKLLIVEDDPMVAKDLQYQVERLGCEVVGLSESAEEAMALAEIYMPDLALMDINIAGNMDGIQTARLLQRTYQTPVVFLTTHNDEVTITRAAGEMPYGYLTKPVAREDLKTTLLVALHRVEAEMVHREKQKQLAVTMDALQEGLLTISLDGTIQFMNAAAERLTGLLPMQVRGRQLSEVVKLREGIQETEIGSLFCEGRSRINLDFFLFDSAPDTPILDGVVQLIEGLDKFFVTIVQLLDAYTQVVGPQEKHDLTRCLLFLVRPE
jgi:DNA-binding NarL/FixJ family response regulator